MPLIDVAVVNTLNLIQTLFAQNRRTLVKMLHSIEECLLKFYIVRLQTMFDTKVLIALWFDLSN